MTQTHCAPGLAHDLIPPTWFNRRLNQLTLSVTLLLSLSASPAVASEAASLIERLGFSTEQAQSVVGGQYVTGHLSSATPRELAVKIAARVPVSPARLVAALNSGMALKENPKVVDFGPLQNPIDPADLEPLSLSPKQIARWKSAGPSESTNLSPTELSKLESTLRESGESNPASIPHFVRQMLFSRTRDYQISGLDGMPPYARSDDTVRSPAHEIRKAIEASHSIHLISEPLYEFLIAYPDKLPEQFSENFFWVLEKGPDGLLVNLTHRFSVPHAKGYIAVQRQFYVTNGYNVEEAISVILPDESGSLILYTNRTSTDQVEGFGGALRRRVGDSLMESELEAILHRVIDRLQSEPSPSTQ